MDSNSAIVTPERGIPSNISGSPRRGTLTSESPLINRPSSLSDTHYHIVDLIVNRDDKGYGMKVSGDNPVYIQSVKDGGAAERAGLHAGDKIIKVNGTTVVHSTHTDVVALIRASSQVVLTVQQKHTENSNTVGTSSRSTNIHSSTTITNPLPVDNEKQHQLQLEKEQHYKLMIEKERRYIDLLRSQLAVSPDEKKFLELSKTEKNLQTLQTMLRRSQSELFPGSPTHQRSKLRPESLMDLGSPDSAREISRIDSERPDEPPGTPPPPYPSPRPEHKKYPSADLNDSPSNHLSISNECSPVRNRTFPDSQTIHAATCPVIQQPIISMEDDEISDQEIEQPEEHGPFKCLARLWEHPPHMAVFMNYVLSNTDPNSLLFYLLTDLYKEGNAKEMRKWAYEIHSTFLVPGAPLRLSNVDENVAREIDIVLTREFDKEEIMRKIFWKARARAKEELSRQLADFQQKRTAGLGTIYGPCDAVLQEVSHDKAKEVKLVETLFVEKLEPSLEELEKENFDIKKYYTVAAITTILSRVFGVRMQTPSVERCPTFVNKEKSFKSKFLVGKYSRKLNILGHQFIPQQYFTVITCNNCHQILYGIAPQGYQCNVCNINLHRHCVKLYDDSCPGPINKKDRGLTKFIRIRPYDFNDHKRKINSQFLCTERERRQAEEKDTEFADNGDNNRPSPNVSRSGSDRRQDVREEAQLQSSPSGERGLTCGSSPQGGAALFAAANPESDNSAFTAASSSPRDETARLPNTGSKKKTSSNINRSESVKENSGKTRKQRRNISDPSQNKSSKLEIDNGAFGNTTDSGSSTNSTSSISYSEKISENGPGHNNNNEESNCTDDSELDADSDHINWQDLVTAEQLSNLPAYEKKRQDVINEIFYTEKSHVRKLNVLHKFFYKPLCKTQILRPDELELIFPNLKEVLDIHRRFNQEMIAKRREDPIVSKIGDTLLSMFDGQSGEEFTRAAARFCERQQLALDFIKERRKRDSKFDTLLCEGEKKRQCRRLPFQGILLEEMQRLSKYHLLLERLIGSFKDDAAGDEEEFQKLHRAHQLSKSIVTSVNEAAKLALNRARLEEIQRHLDQSNFERSNDPISHEFRPLDLTKYTLVREGPMNLRRQNKAPVPVHVLLTEEVVVILHREGDRFHLKNFQLGAAPGQTPGHLSPIIKMSTLLVRNNASFKNALFLVNTSTINSQMYDLRAEDDSKRDLWYKYFTEVSEAYSRKEGKTRMPEPMLDSEDSESVQEFPAKESASERISGPEETAPNSLEESARLSIHSERDESNISSENSDGLYRQEQSNGTVGLANGEEEPQQRITAEDWPLIQPSQVQIISPPVHLAESKLTTLEQLKRKDDEVRRGLAEKERILADLLCVPQNDLETITDMVSEDFSSMDGVNLIMASIYETDRLNHAVNEALNVKNEADLVAVTAATGKAACNLHSVENDNGSPLSIQPAVVQDIANRLNRYLTELLDKHKQMEEEKTLLRNELHKVRERLHEQLAIHDSSNSMCAFQNNGDSLENQDESEQKSES